jgi:hypothetical protein
VELKSDGRFIHRHWEIPFKTCWEYRDRRQEEQPTPEEKQYQE